MVLCCCLAVQSFAAENFTVIQLDDDQTNIEEKKVEQNQETNLINEERELIEAGVIEEPEEVEGPQEVSGATGSKSGDLLQPTTQSESQVYIHDSDIKQEETNQEIKMVRDTVFVKDTVYQKVYSADEEQPRRKKRTSMSQQQKTLLLMGIGAGAFLLMVTLIAGTVSGN